MKEKYVFHIDVNNAFLSWTAVYLLQKDVFLENDDFFVQVIE